MKKVISVLVAVALLASMSVLSMTSASADEAKWTLPLDVTDANWHAESFSPTYKWSAPLAEVADTIIGESNADGTMTLKFPEGGKTDMTYPNARYENAGGIVHVLEDDYINIKLSCGEAGQTSVRFAILLNFLANQINLTEAMVEAGAQSFNDEGLQVVGGDYEFSIKVSDAAKKYYETHADAKGSYDAIWGAGGNDFLTGIVFYIYSAERDAATPLVVKEVTVGPKGAAAGDNGGAAAGDNGSTNNGGTTSTASKAPSANKAPSGNKAPVKTGESVLPIIGVAALAVVAGSAVVVSRKRK